MNFFYLSGRVFFLGLCLCLCIPPLSFSQTVMDVEEDQLFEQQSVTIKARIRHVTLEDVTPEAGKEIVVYTRQGAFPNWKGELHIYTKTKSLNRVVRHSGAVLPPETIYYGFFAMGSKPQLALVLPSEVQIVPFDQGKWNFELKQVFPLSNFTAPWAKSTAVPFKPLQKVQDDLQVWIPSTQGYQTFLIEGEKLRQKDIIALQPKSFYRSSHDLLPFEMSYWFRNIFWYPKIYAGSLDGKSQKLFSPWMDELDIVSPDQENKTDKHYFRLLSERERDNGIHYLINEPVDLNGDGRMDFVLNKFQGVGTSFKSKSYYYMTGSDGLIPKRGKLVPFPKKKTAGAMVRDITLNGKQDFLIISSVLNVWSMVRALTKKQVLLSFDIHLFGKDQKDYNFKKADVSRDILFDFSLRDFFIEGILPTLDGDFNGDGYPDVMYARNIDELSFLIQKPGKPKLFDTVPSGLYSMRLPKKYRIGDITGDGKADLVFFNTRSGQNLKFKVLMNNGLL